MKINEEEVKVLKLITGEEIVGELLKHEGGVLSVRAPLGVAPSPQGLQLVPMMFSADIVCEVDLYADKVVAMAPARSDMIEAYKQSVDPSGIITPKKQIITG